MNSQIRLSVALGVAFLFQATTSLISGMIPMSLIVPGNIDQSMTNIAAHAGLMRANFLGDLITGVGVIALAARGASLDTPARGGMALAVMNR